MDSPNLDLVRSIYTAWGRGYRSSAEWAHPQIEFVIADGPSPFATTACRAWENSGAGGPAPGRASAWRRKSFASSTTSACSCCDRYSGRGKGSGVRLEQVHAEAAIVMRVREGKVTRLAAYNDRENALTYLA